MASKCYIDELCTPYFSEIGDGFKSKFKRGQLFWAPVAYAPEDLQFWRPQMEETNTSAHYFFISRSTKNAFKKDKPLVDPKLEIDEEFLVVRAKMRPIILVTPTPYEIDIKPVRGGGKINRNNCLVAPLYSIYDSEGLEKYPTAFIDRIRKLEFPNLFFIPQKEPIKHSICRLDSLLSITWTKLEAIDLMLGEETLKLFFQQLDFFLTDKYIEEQDYHYYRKELQVEV